MLSVARIGFPSSRQEGKDPELALLSLACAPKGKDGGGKLSMAALHLSEDELMEVTPAAIRPRKRRLDPEARKRAAREDLDRR